MKARFLLYSVLLSVVSLLPASYAEVPFCEFTPLEGPFPPNIWVATACGNAEVSESTFRIWAPSDVPGWLTGLTWSVFLGWPPPEDLPEKVWDEDLGSNWSASSLALWFTPEFASSGGNVSFDYEANLGGLPGYVEIGQFWLQGADGEDNLPLLFSFSPWVSATEDTSGHISDFLSPISCEGDCLNAGGIYAMLFVGSELDPELSVTNFQLRTGVEPIPEPATAWLLAGGLAAVVLCRRRLA